MTQEIEDTTIKCDKKSLWRHVIQPLMEYTENHPTSTHEEKVKELQELWDKLPEEDQKNYKRFKKYLTEKYDNIHLQRIK